MVNLHSECGHCKTWVSIWERDLCYVRMGNGVGLFFNCSSCQKRTLLDTDNYEMIPKRVKDRIRYFGGDSVEMKGKVRMRNANSYERKYTVRGEHVLVKMEKRQTIVEGSKIQVSEKSMEAKLFRVVAMGPDVNKATLNVGDSVLMKARTGEEYHPLPRSNDLFLVDQGAIAIVYSQEFKEVE